jgi:hypothetical protein
MQFLTCGALAAHSARLLKVCVCRSAFKVVEIDARSDCELSELIKLDRYEHGAVIGREEALRAIYDRHACRA